MLNMAFLVSIATFSFIIAFVSLLDRKSDSFGSVYFPLYAVSIGVWSLGLVSFYFQIQSPVLKYSIVRLILLSTIGVIGHGSGYIFQNYRHLIPYKKIFFSIAIFATSVMSVLSFFIPVTVSLVNGEIFIKEQTGFFSVIYNVYKIGMLVYMLFISILIFKNTRFRREKIPVIIIGIILILVLRIVLLHAAGDYQQHSQIYSLVPILFLFFYTSHISNATALKISNCTGYLYSSVNTPIILISPDGICSLMNKSAIQFFHLSSSELSGVRFANLFLTEKLFEVPLYDEVKSERHTKIEGVSPQTGAVCDIDLTSIYDAYGELLCTVAVMNDVSFEMKLIRQLREMNDVAIKVNEIACKLMSINPENSFDTDINKCLGVLGVFVKRNRVYIWKNHSDKQGRLSCSLIYEWSKGVSAQIQNPQLQNVVYDKREMPFICQSLKNKTPLNMLVKDMSIGERKMLEPQEIRAILLSPIIISDNVWGYIGFDNCTDESLFSAAEERVLQITGSLFASAILKKEEAEKLADSRARALAASEAKSNFLANMSHEIRTPMNAIIGITELLLNEKSAKNIRSYATTIKNAANSLLAIINDILDFSKIESGRFDIVCERYYFESLANDVITIISLKLAEKNITFFTDFADDIPRELIGDEIRLKQILMNLLSNAVKFTRQGSITLRAFCKPDSDNPNSVLLYFSVTDTGIGIKEEDVKKLFTSFTQVDTRRNRSVEGTGLGLAICRQLTDLLGGEISVKSEYGKGSVFEFFIRQQVADATPTKNSFLHSSFSGILPEKVKKPKNLFSAPDAHVLVVDDNAVNLQVAEGLLRHYGLRVTSALSGLEALALVAANSYDLILLDHMMPEMDGVETLQKMRVMGGFAASVPVIAFTANAVSGIKAMFLEHGFSDFLSKPLELVRLEAVLATWLPPEKIRRTLSGKPQTVRTEFDLPDLTFLDVEKGIKQTGGKPEYMRILKLVCDSSAEKLSEVKNAFRTKNLPLFTVHIHAIKSDLRLIGAEELSQTAKQLEDAGHRADSDFIRLSLSDFCRRFSVLIKKIRQALSVIDQTTRDSDIDGMETADFLRQLKKLVRALESGFDEEVKSFLTVIETDYFKSEYAEFIRAISRCIHENEYDIAAKRVKGFLLDSDRMSGQ